MRIRQIATGPKQWAVVYAWGDGYRVVEYKVFQGIIANGAALGNALKEQGRGIFAKNGNGVAA